MRAIALDSVSRRMAIRTPIFWKGSTAMNLLASLTGNNPCATKSWGSYALVSALACFSFAPVTAAPGGGEGIGAQEDSRPIVPDTIEVQYDIPYRDGNKMWMLDLAMPKQRGDKPRPGLVFIHGGGWSSNDKQYRYFAQGPVDFAQKGYVCVSVNYRLTGEAPFPACVQDVRCAVRWLRAHAEDYNLDPDRIGGYGNSAGGHLVAMLGLAVDNDPELDGDAPYQEYSSALQAVFASAAPTDFIPWEDQGGERTGPLGLLGAKDAGWESRARKASPIYYANSEAPAFFILHGVEDDTVPLPQAQKFADVLTEAGARDVTLLMMHGVGHNVFLECKDVTQPAMERFFFRTLMAANTETGSAGVSRAEGATVDDSARIRQPREPQSGLLHFGAVENKDVYSNPYMTGGLINVLWSEVEKENGVCDWSLVEEGMKPWIEAGKKVAIRIMWSSSGYWPRNALFKTPTPQWVWDEGAVFAFHEPSGTEIPLIWDPIYEKFAWRFLEQFEEKYGDNPDVLFVDVTPGAETNPYRFGTINRIDPDFKDTFEAIKASDGRNYTEELWMDTLKEWIEAADRVILKTPLLVTLNNAGLRGPDRLVEIGQHCVDRGIYVGQNGLAGGNYTDPETGRTKAFLDWSKRTKLCFEMVAATGERTGTLMEVMEAAERIRASYLNVYAVDVLRATQGHDRYDPEYEEALMYGHEALKKFAPPGGTDGGGPDVARLP